MELPGPKSLRSANTARTYPVGAEELARAVEGAIQSLPRWTVTRATVEKIEGVRRARIFGFEDYVTIHLTPSPVGAHTNTRAEFWSASRIAVWDLGQNGRNLEELLAAIDQQLTTVRSRQLTQPISPCNDAGTNPTRSQVTSAESPEATRSPLPRTAPRDAL